MPVTLQWEQAEVGTTRLKPVADYRDLIQSEDKRRQVLHTSVSRADNGAVVPHDNGFVFTVLRAWQQDQHLELRPDDVWLSVLTQFSFYVNGKGTQREVLRRRFAAHEGQRRLEIVYPQYQTIEQVDVATMVQHFAGLIREQLVDPELADWLQPSFSTTLPRDKAVAAAAFLGTMRQYFEYGIVLGCGFPSVTLHGEREDWADLSRRVAKFAELEEATVNNSDSANADMGSSSLSQWSRALKIVIDFMAAGFDRPTDGDVRNFWGRACHSVGEDGSGETITMSGWLTAFCWWRADGTRQKSYSDSELSKLCQLREHGTRLELGGVEFPVVDQEEIPAAYTRAPITFRLADGHLIDTVLVAGCTGAMLIDGEGTTEKPFSGWWLLTAENAAQIQEPSINGPFSTKEPLFLKAKSGRVGDKPTRAEPYTPGRKRKSLAEVMQHYNGQV